MNLLTTEEVAEKLNIEPETIVNWRYKGKTDLPFIRIGRLIRYRPEDVEKFVEKNTKGAA